ncbi:MAG: glycosyl transferase, group 1, partial [Ilumatobacteraceae bacterium]|nr:glycosyl transferase, group 1 [Ilumatobacteraceae bacterium]
MMLTMRVAFTLEQCWHRVPGGTAVAAMRIAAALRARGDVELVGVAGRHRGAPPAAWDPQEPVAQLRLA